MRPLSVHLSSDCWRCSLWIHIRIRKEHSELEDVTIAIAMSEPYLDLSEPPKASSALAKQPSVAWLVLSRISPTAIRFPKRYEYVWFMQEKENFGFESHQISGSMISCEEGLVYSWLRVEFSSRTFFLLEEKMGMMYRTRSTKYAFIREPLFNEPEKRSGISILMMDVQWRCRRAE